MFCDYLDFVVIFNCFKLRIDGILFSKVLMNCRSIKLLDVLVKLLVVIEIDLSFLEVGMNRGFDFYCN